MPVPEYDKKVQISYVIVRGHVHVNFGIAYNFEGLSD